MEKEYAQHLSQIHSKLKTPHDIILGAVREVTTSEIVAKRRIIAGEANEVYDIRLADNREIIMRISRDNEKDFEQERWAIDQCAALEIPVPGILLIKHLSSTDNPLDICIQEKLEGDVVKDGQVKGIIDWGEVAGGDPMNDFAEWDYWDGERIPLAWLKEGYGTKMLLEDRFDERLSLKRLEYGLCVLGWYDHRGFARGVEDAKIKLSRDLEFLAR